MCDRRKNWSYEKEQLAQGYLHLNVVGVTSNPSDPKHTLCSGKLIGDHQCVTTSSSLYSGPF